MTPRRRNLLVVGAAVIACAIGLLVTRAVLVGLVVPAALFLPGYALQSALFGHRITWAERLPLSVVLSLAVCITGGFALNWSPWGLGPGTWALLVLAVTAGGATATGLRLRREREAGPAAAYTVIIHRARLWRPGRSALALALAAILAVGALAFAQTPLPARGVAGYTVLSLRPDGSRIRVAVDSAELRTTSYRLEVRAGGRIALEREITLRPGVEWRGVVDVRTIPTKQRSLEALLFRKGERAVPYRRATLVLPGSEFPPATTIWLLWVNIDTLRVSVPSAESRRTRFRFELLLDGHLEGVTLFTLLPGEQWNRLVDISPIPVQGSTVFEARLYQQGERADRLIHRVTLTPADF